MIDVENKIIDTVIEQVQAVFPSCNITSMPDRSPSAFPCVNIVEKDNSVHGQSMTLNCPENHANLMYEVSVYSNIEEGNKGQAKEILSVVDDTMSALGFRRTFMNPIPDVDITIYRVVARYTGVASKGFEGNGTIIHKIYRI